MSFSEFFSHRHGYLTAKPWFRVSPSSLCLNRNREITAWVRHSIFDHIFVATLRWWLEFSPCLFANRWKKPRAGTCSFQPTWQYNKASSVPGLSLAASKNVCYHGIIAMIALETVFTGRSVSQWGTLLLRLRESSFKINKTLILRDVVFLKHIIPPPISQALYT